MMQSGGAAAKAIVSIRSPRLLQWEPDDPSPGTKFSFEGWDKLRTSTSEAMPRDSATNDRW